MEPLTCVENSTIISRPKYIHVLYGFQIEGINLLFDINGAVVLGKWFVYYF